MDIKKVMVRKFESGNLKGFASINVGDDMDTLTIDGLRIMEKKDGSGMFIAFPSTAYKKDGKTEYKDVCFPVNAELRTRIQAAVLKKYAATGDDKPKDKEYTKSKKQVDDEDEKLPF